MMNHTERLKNNVFINITFTNTISAVFSKWQSVQKVYRECVHCNKKSYRKMLKSAKVFTRVLSRDIIIYENSLRIVCILREVTRSVRSIFVYVLPERQKTIIF